MPRNTLGAFASGANFASFEGTAGFPWIFRPHQQGEFRPPLGRGTNVTPMQGGAFAQTASNHLVEKPLQRVESRAIGLA